MHIRQKLVLLIGLLALVLGLSSGALAAGLEVYATGGYASLSMDKFNEFIDSVNELFKPAAQQEGASFEPLERITRAFWGEGGLRYAVTPALFVSASVRYMAPNGSDAKSSSKDLFDPTVTYTRSMQLSASVWGPTLTVGTPLTLPGTPVTVTLAGSVGYYVLTVRLDESYDSSPGEAYDWAISTTAGASALGYGLRGTVTYALSPQLRLEGTVGYERLYYEKVTVQSASAKNAPTPKTGDPLEDMDGNPLPFDLSGIRATIGLSYSF